MAWMGRELTRGWVEEHAKGEVALLGKSWCAWFDCLELVVGAESRSLAGLESSAGLTDTAESWPA